MSGRFEIHNSIRNRISIGKAWRAYICRAIWPAADRIHIATVYLAIYIYSHSYFDSAIWRPVCVVNSWMSSMFTIFICILNKFSQFLLLQRLRCVYSTYPITHNQTQAVRWARTRARSLGNWIADLLSIYYCWDGESEMQKMEKRRDVILSKKVRAERLIFTRTRVSGRMRYCALSQLYMTGTMRLYHCLVLIVSLNRSRSKKTAILSSCFTKDRRVNMIYDWCRNWYRIVTAAQHYRLHQVLLADDHKCWVVRAKRSKIQYHEYVVDHAILSRLSDSTRRPNTKSVLVELSSRRFHSLISACASSFRYASHCGVHNQTDVVIGYHQTTNLLEMLIVCSYFYVCLCAECTRQMQHSFPDVFSYRHHRRPAVCMGLFSRTDVDWTCVCRLFCFS